MVNNMTFEENNINYNLEIKTIRSKFKKGADWDNIMDCASMLLMNSDIQHEHMCRALIKEIQVRSMFDRTGLFVMGYKV